MEPTQVRLTIPDSVDPTTLMGPADTLLRRVEGAFDAMVSVRGNQVSVSGPADVVDQVTSVFSRLIRLVEMGEAPSAGEVDVIIDQVRHGAERSSSGSDYILLTFRGRAIRPKTSRQLLTALGLAEECALVARDGELLTPDRQIWPNDELLVRKVASVG